MTLTISPQCMQEDLPEQCPHSLLQAQTFSFLASTRTSRGCQASLLAVNATMGERALPESNSSFLPSVSDSSVLQQNFLFHSQFSLHVCGGSGEAPQATPQDVLWLHTLILILIPILISEPIHKLNRMRQGETSWLYSSV